MDTSKNTNISPIEIAMEVDEVRKIQKRTITQEVSLYSDTVYMQLDNTVLTFHSFG